MVMRTRNTELKEKTFVVILEPVNEFITTDDLERKLRLMCGGCGIRIVSAEQLDESEHTKEKEY